MKKYLLIILSLVSVFVNAQNAVYTFDFIHSKKKMKSLNHTPKIYSLNYRDVVNVYGGTKKELKNKEYLNFKLELDSLKGKRKFIETSYNTKVEETNNISVNIKNFLNSKENFENKKHWLKDAQVLSEKYGFNFLIFSNNKVNPDHSSKFMILSQNSLDFKIHLKRVIWEMEKFKVKEPEGLVELSTKIESLESKLNNTDETLVTKSKKVTKKRKAMFVNKLEELNENLLKGDFFQVGSCYIIEADFTNNGYSFKKGEIVKLNKAFEKNIVGHKKVSSLKVLFQKKGRNITYVSDKNFLEKYAFLKNGKFNKQKPSSYNNISLSK